MHGLDAGEVANPDSLQWNHRAHQQIIWLMINELLLFRFNTFNIIVSYQAVTCVILVVGATPGIRKKFYLNINIAHCYSNENCPWLP